MKQLLFFIGFIWPLVAVGSLFLGPFVGIDRSKLRSELIDFWHAKLKSRPAMLARRMALAFAWSGFLFPVVFPLPGFAIGLGFFFIFILI